MLSIHQKICTLIAVLVSSVTFAQNISVSGNVTDANTGEPVPYASVHLEGTMIGVSTDNEGHYTISVPHDGLLVFSSIGYKTTEVTVASSGTINVQLHPDSEFLDETIVVAYGTATRSSFTGSASTPRISVAKPFLLRSIAMEPPISPSPIIPTFIAICFYIPLFSVG